MIRVDKNEIPRIVQQWSYAPSSLFEVRLCNDKVVMLDIYAVRDNSCRGYRQWDADKDQMAIDRFVEDYKYLFFDTNKS